MAVPRSCTQIHPVMHPPQTLSPHHLPLGGRAEGGMLKKGNSYTLNLQEANFEELRSEGARSSNSNAMVPLLGLAPLLLSLGIEARHHRTFLAGLAFTLIRLTAFGFHGCPSLPAAASHDQATGWH